MPNMPSIVSFFGLRSPSKIEISDDEGSVSSTDLSEKQISKNAKAFKSIEETQLAVESDDDEDDDEVAEDELVKGSLREKVN